MRYRYPMELSNYLAVFAIAVVLYYVIRRLALSQEQQVAAAELEAKLAEAQLDNLRLQLQPHFLFNTLNTISSVMYEDVPAADAMLTQLSELLRLTLRTSRSQEISLAQELRITRLYLDLMHKRFEEKLGVSYAVDPALGALPRPTAHPAAARRELAPPRVETGQLGALRVRRRAPGRRPPRAPGVGYRCGLGPDAAACLTRGVGLSNIERRLERLYGEKQRLSIANREGGGAEVTLSAPVPSDP